MAKALIMIMLATSFFLSSIAQVTADQPYVGGYLDGTVVNGSRVIADVYFRDTDYSSIPSSKWLGTVISVAGALNNNPITNPSGVVYQNGLLLLSNGSVRWAPQAWLIGYPLCYYEKSVGNCYYVAYYERIDISSPSVTYKIFAYPSGQSHDNDNPAIYTWLNQTYAGDTTFLIGKQLHDGVYYKHFQFGVESNQRITETQWSVGNNMVAYYNGTAWYYYSGKTATYGNNAITWASGSAWGIGGEAYAGVDAVETDAQYVRWNYTGTSVSNDVSLWTQSGISYDWVSKPYQ